MKEVDTNTPVATEEGEERQEQGEQEQQEQGQEQQREGGKKSNWIPYYRLQEVVRERDDLKKEIEELQGLREKAKVYDSLVDLIEKNPEYARELNELYQRHFGVKEQTSETEFEDENYKQLRDKFEMLELEIREQKMQNLQRQWDQEMQDIIQDAKKRGMTISEIDIYNTMNSKKIYSPKEAYNLLLGSRIDDIYKIWESNLQKDLRNKKENFPSIPSSLRPGRKLVSSIEEAFELLKI